jgi:hypothetical protein
MPGSLYIACGKFDETAYSQAIDVRADTNIDIDATPFHTCLFLGGHSDVISPNHVHSGSPGAARVVFVLSRSPSP